MQINTPSPAPQSIESRGYVINIIVYPCIWKKSGLLWLFRHLTVLIPLIPDLWLCSRRFWDFYLIISFNCPYSSFYSHSTIIIIIIRTTKITLNLRTSTLSVEYTCQ